MQIKTAGGAVVASGVGAALILYSFTGTMQSVQQVVLPMVNLTIEQWRGSAGIFISAGFGIIVAIFVFLIIVAFIIIRNAIFG